MCRTRPIDWNIASEGDLSNVRSLYRIKKQKISLKRSKHNCHFLSFPPNFTSQLSLPVTRKVFNILNNNPVEKHKANSSLILALQDIPQFNSCHFLSLTLMASKTLLLSVISSNRAILKDIRLQSQIKDCHCLSLKEAIKIGHMSLYVIDYQFCG